MRRILVTGGAGFIGANFVHYWLLRYPEDKLVVLDKLTYAGCASSLDSVTENERYAFQKGCIGDRSLVQSLLLKHEIDTVVNFAAESHVDRSITGPDEFIETNVSATHRLLNACRDVWIEQGKKTESHRFHHISTDEVYGSLGPTDPAFTENTQYRPNSPYSASKASSDHLVRAYHHTYGLNTTTSNCSNNYGPYQFPEKLIPLCITNLLLGKKLPIYGDGKNIRDWLFVEDHCRAVDLVVRKGVAGEVYNVGGNCESTNLLLVETICNEFDRFYQDEPELFESYPENWMAKSTASDAIDFVVDRPGHDRRYAVNASKISVELGFEPLIGLEEGI
ncbi:MAG: dTDP-glucose 4,6-dehydratase, partial [Pseudomonadales bacterium]|nr:dTDP-glucose 4,6-dehydratase [Pseudomonadales bacterium]